MYPATLLLFFVLLPGFTNRALRSETGLFYHLADSSWVHGDIEFKLDHFGNNVTHPQDLVMTKVRWILVMNNSFELFLLLR